MPSTYRSPQGDSAKFAPGEAGPEVRVPSVLNEALDFEVPTGWHVEWDDDDGVAVRDADDQPLASIDSLNLAAGRRPGWRRPRIGQVAESEREAFVALGVATGRTTSDMAAELGVSERTITTLRRIVKDRNATLVDAPAVGSLGVAVTGRSGLTRSLFRACLARSRDDVNEGGASFLDDAVRVVVLPAARDLRMYGNARLVVVGALPHGLSLLDAVRAGMVSHLSIGVAPSVLAEAVEAASAGRTTMSANVVDELVRSLQTPSDAPTELSSRDRDVVEGISSGESVKQTARRLGVKPKTVENRRQQLYARFGVRSAHELQRQIETVFGPGLWEEPGDGAAGGAGAELTDPVS